MIQGSLDAGAGAFDYDRVAEIAATQAILPTCLPVIHPLYLSEISAGQPIPIIFGGRMERSEFMETLSREGFPEAVAVVKDSAGSAPEHTHPFEAKALILAGDMRIRVGDSERVYHVGDIFHLQAGVVHAENYGEHGVTYLVGRKVDAAVS
jgi:hypothetical protein